MKYIKLFENFFITESMEEIELVLYHGSLKNFDKFKNQTSYFSDNANMAYEYPRQKAFDEGNDSNIVVYLCKFKGKIFNAKNKEDLEKLIPLIPETTTVNHGTAWFLTAEIPKKNMIKMLQGIETIYPIEGIEDPEIGKLVPDPDYNQEKFIIVDFDEDWVYTISQVDYRRYLEASKLGYDENLRHYNEFSKSFYEYRKAVLDWYNKATNSNENIKYASTNKFGDFQNTYEYAKKGYSINYVNPYDKTKQEFKLEEKDKIHIENILKSCLEDFKKVAYSKMKRKKWTRREKDIENSDYWNYYESQGVISDAIKKLGYDGYVAKETFQRKVYNSYCIFEPNKTIEIIKKEKV